MSRVLVPALVLLAGLLVAASAGSELFSSRSLSDPFDYANAKGAFFLQVSIAGGLLWATGSGRGAKALGVVGAAGATIVVLASGSLAASTLLVLVAAASFTHLLRERGAPAVMVTAAVFFLLILAGTSFLALSADPGLEADDKGQNRRLILWGEAADLMRDKPLTGIGPGRFRFASPTAIRDPDARWAHHGFLQQGAETGVPGLILLVAAFIAAFGCLLAQPRADSGGALAAVSLGALGAHACVDYILHFGAIPVAAAALIGGQAGWVERANGISDAG